mgnify:CR=1 FL=1
MWCCNARRGVKLLSYNPNKNPINQSRIRNLEMDDKWISHFLKKVQVGHFVTMDKNQPFINPSSFWYSSKNHEIYFHSNAYGRMRFNADKQLKASFECFKSGKLLPSNLALEMSFQYECVIAFGTIMVVQEIDENDLASLLQDVDRVLGEDNATVFEILTCAFIKYAESFKAVSYTHLTLPTSDLV